ncbi:MAG: hypothetical protein DMG49_12860 [Acidobacteria bacterium]|nr:MAG: hypothetical protein DMG49_12860 [Acidobacteriota bacterium]
MTGVPIGAPVLFCAAKYFRYDVAMSTILMHAGRALTPTTEITDAGILIREDTIEAIGPRSGMTLPAGGLEIRATNMTAVPGFMDLHIHGAGGHDVMAGTGAALRAITRKVSEYGTTSIVATTLTASTDQTLRAVEGIARYIAQQHETDEPRAEILGIHFEGPFISKERRGVHPSEWIQLPSAETLSRFLKAAMGSARILTIAPELLGAAPCIDAAREAGLVVSMGHSTTPCVRFPTAIRASSAPCSLPRRSMRS